MWKRRLWKLALLVLLDARFPLFGFIYKPPSDGIFADIYRNSFDLYDPRCAK